MDIAKIFNYEQTFPLELVNPDNDEPLGIVFNIRSMESDEAKKLQRKQIDDTMERRQRGKLLKADAEIQKEIEKAATCVASWDWGSHEYDGEKLDCTLKNISRVLSEQGWIFAQVTEAAANLKNFTATSEKPSPKASAAK